MLPKISVYSGDITGTEASFLVNSSNGYLLQGSGTAEQIRNRLGRLVDSEALQDYQKLLSEAKWPLKPALDYMHNIQKREPSVFQHESLKLIIRDRNSRPLQCGDAALLTLENFAVSNAVGMTYCWKKKPVGGSLPIEPATKESVKNSLKKSLAFAEELKCNKIATPIMCTRKGGLKKEESAEATGSAIREHFSQYADSAINEVVISLYDKTLQNDEKFFRNYFGEFSS